MLLIVASALWWHRWLPALLLAGVLSWAVLHRQLEGDPGRALGRLWRRAWPPGTIVLIPLLLSGTLAYWVASEPIRPKILPIALNVVALSIILFGNWWALFAHEAESDRARLRPSVQAAASAGKASSVHG